MSLQTRLGSLITAIGADVKAHNAELTALKNASIIANRPTDAQEIFPRELATSDVIAATSGQVALNYFTAYKTETIASLRSYTGNTAAGLTPVLCRKGLYTIDPSTLDLTLVASTPNDTTLWGTAFTTYTKALSSSYGVVAGTRYVYAQIIVTVAALPTWPSRNAPSWAGITTPRIYGQRGSQTDLPATISNANIVNGTANRYAQLVP